MVKQPWWSLLSPVDRVLWLSFNLAYMNGFKKIGDSPTRPTYQLGWNLQVASLQTNVFSEHRRLAPIGNSSLKPCVSGVWFVVLVEANKQQHTINHDSPRSCSQKTGTFPRSEVVMKYDTNQPKLKCTILRKIPQDYQQHLLLVWSPPLGSV